MTLSQANLEDVVCRQREDRADAAFLVEEVDLEDASRYGACDTNKHGKITEVVKKLDNPLIGPRNDPILQVHTRNFHTYHPVQLSNRVEYETSEVINLLIQSDRTIDAIGFEDC
ncbi:hypothetical protein EXE40_11100 [Halorubrum sp. GN11GM_10-3_MGM]|nr:hypothetical protein [Halorubrum sp. GN11GM_10-3_MGM]TKX69183.1 hypothetical protein EXE40_11100 [Halorubrum sp. GN11GM_10-3_MGM]